MSAGQLLTAYTIGTAALALWAYVRWPSAAPPTLMRAVLRVVVALILLQLGLAALELGLGLAPALAVLVLVVTVVPVLTFAFLASLWFLRLCAEQARGAA